MAYEICIRWVEEGGGREGGKGIIFQSSGYFLNDTRFCYPVKNTANSTKNLLSNIIS